MAIDTKEANGAGTGGLAAENAPKILISWEFPERIRYERGTLWYIIAITLGTGLLIYAVISANFLFALIVLLFALIFYVNTVMPPKNMRLTITEDGIEMGREFFPFTDLSSFWFIYEPPVVKNLYLGLKNSLRQQISADLADTDPNEVRVVLSRYIREDFTKDEESMSEVVSRFLKI